MATQHRDVRSAYRRTEMRTFFAGIEGPWRAANRDGNDEQAPSTAEQGIVADVGYHVNVQYRALDGAVIHPIVTVRNETRGISYADVGQGQLPR